MKHHLLTSLVSRRELGAHRSPEPGFGAELEEHPAALDFPSFTSSFLLVPSRDKDAYLHLICRTNGTICSNVSLIVPETIDLIILQQTAPSAAVLGLPAYWFVFL